VTRLALIRHARTEWNAEGRIQGLNDSPLTPDGLESARSWSGTLAPFNFSALYSSPLGRAMHTARVVGGPLGLQPVPVEDLREQAFGEWTGRTVAELRAQGVLAQQEALGWAFTPPGGEDRRAVLERAWNCLVDMAARHVGESVLVVTHEGVLRALLYALKGRDYLPDEPKILAPRALHVLCAQDGCLRIEAWNQTL